MEREESEQETLQQVALRRSCHWPYLPPTYTSVAFVAVKPRGTRLRPSHKVKRMKTEKKSTHLVGNVGYALGYYSKDYMGENAHRGYRPEDPRSNPLYWQREPQRSQMLERLKKLKKQQKITQSSEQTPKAVETETT